MTDKVERRLAAILSADVVGFSRLMEADEKGTLARLKAHRAELFDPITQVHGGRIVKLMGDGALVEFASAVDAVECAAEIQRGMSVRNEGLTEDGRITLRIGVNLGDVIIEGEDIYGEGVNIAARLQGLAAPGGVSVSGKVYDEVSGKVDAVFEDQGEKSVKNIAQPVRVFALSSADEAAVRRGVGGEALPLPSKPSIAVLPFSNLSSDADQDHFADVLTEDITTALSRYRDLFVISSHSAFAFKGKAGDVKQIARELGVRYILEGSVRWAGGRVRIGPQLIDALTDGHVWAERYDGKVEDIFDLQDELTAKTAAAVGSGILTAEIESAKRQRPGNLDAYGLYAQGVGHWMDITREGLVKAKKSFSEAIDLDPGFSNAHAYLGWVHNLEVVFGWAEDPQVSQQKSYEASRRAVELDLNNETAHAFLAFALLFRGEHEMAGAEAKHALDLNPNLAIGYCMRSFVNVFSGRHQEGLADGRAAIRLSPRDSFLVAFENIVAFGAYLAGDYETCVEGSSALAAKYPDFIFGHVTLAMACAQLGQIERANKALKEALRVSPNLVDTIKFQPLKEPADAEHYLDGLRKAGLEI